MKWYEKLKKKRLISILLFSYSFFFFLQTVDEEDERALAMFMNPAAPKRLLSDIIMEKIAQHGIHCSEFFVCFFLVLCFLFLAFWFLVFVLIFLFI